MKIFKLFECCLLTSGISRALISDTQRSTFQYIPLGLFEILTIHKNKPTEEIQKIYNNEVDKEITDYFDFLVTEEYGFWCDEQDIMNFPEIEKTYSSPDIINNCIVDIGTQSNHDYGKIMSDLKDLRCKYLELRFFSKVSLEELEHIIKLSVDTVIRNIDIYAPYDSAITAEMYYQGLLSKYIIVGKLIIHSAPERIVFPEDEKHALSYTIQKLTSANCCGNISIYDFSTDLQMYLEALKFNTCLNKKVSIDELGNIKNCPSLEKSFGNHNMTDLKSVVDKDEFRYVWTLNKDQVEVCKDCEHRYICTDCRAYVDNILDKPKKCKYNPYTTTWQ